MKNRKLKPHEYECKGCHKVFNKGWSDEEARQEFYENFPGEPIDERTDLICDVCYDLIMADMKEHPEKYEGLN